MAARTLVLVALAVAQLLSGVESNCIPSCTPSCCYVETCHPGPVVQEHHVVNKPVSVPYVISTPVVSQKCCQHVDSTRKVVPLVSTSEHCKTHQTVVKVPSTDILVKEQPLCKKTCTTSEYVIQIPIIETVCTSSPLCQRTVCTQDNVMTSVSKKNLCSKKTCTQNKVIETPIYHTVCQKYQNTINKCGTKTVLKPEVVTTCKQLPPYKTVEHTCGPHCGYDCAPACGSVCAPAAYEVCSAPTCDYDCAPACGSVCAPAAYEVCSAPTCTTSYAPACESSCAPSYCGCY